MEFRANAVKALFLTSTLLQTLAMFASVEPGYHPVETYSDTPLSFDVTVYSGKMR
jgi:hypothetical protein